MVMAQLVTHVCSGHQGSAGHLGKKIMTISKCRLLFKGEERGVHPFLVQLRDEQTHQPLPGISFVMVFNISNFFNKLLCNFNKLVTTTTVMTNEDCNCEILHF